MIDTTAPRRQHYPDPTESDLNDPTFNAIWAAIKGWDLSRRYAEHRMYSGATGNDVMRILMALRALATRPAPEQVADAVTPGKDLPPCAHCQTGGCSVPATVHLCKHCFARGKADAEQAGWIPVGERSPEEGAVVLVSEGADLYRAYREDGQWMALSSAFPRAKVTHWMPLPPPPAAAKGGA